MKRILITGSGMVAQGLVSAATTRGMESLVVNHDSADVTVPGSIEQGIAGFKPDCIFHTAALTRVNFCDEHPEEAFRVNAGGTANVVAQAREAGLPVVVFSTDYVFDGTRENGWIETDPPAPLNVYGKSKLAAELETRQYESGHIVRTSGVFGPRFDGKPERNFFKAILEQVSSAQERVPVVSDQFTAVTYAPYLGEMLLTLCESGLPRIVHLVCDGSDSWSGWACQATGILGIAPDRIQPVPSKTLSTGTLRPLHSVLKSCSRGIPELTGQFRAICGISEYLQGIAG